MSRGQGAARTGPVADRCGRSPLLPWPCPPYTRPMGRLRTDKIRPLCGIATLAVFLLAVVNVAGESTDEGLLLVVIVGALVAFLLGYGAGPALLRRFGRAGKRPARARGARRPPTDRA